MSDGYEEGGAESLVSSLVKEFTGMKDKLKNEDEYYSPFDGIDKSDVLQEARAFHEVQLNPRTCIELITKLLYLLVQGETFSDKEAVEIFFGVTKLFQTTDPNLRRMMYLFIKEMNEAVSAEEVIIVVSALIKDMNSSEDLFRANACRVLCKIIDATMLGQIERYIKQSIVDRNALVASSALISGIHLIRIAPDIVRRWVNEVQEAVSTGLPMVQYHALCLLYQIKSQGHDRLAVSKFVTQMSRTGLRSPLAMCQLIHYTAKLLHSSSDIDPAVARSSYDFLQSCLRHKNEMVIYEAARAICALPGINPRDLAPAIVVLQLFLGSPKPTLRFAAVRTLNRVAMLHPMAITKCNDDMERLITDPNRSIATLAITTLLKTGNEGSIERLMKQIGNFMSEIADEFKVVVVDAIRSLAIKYPKKHALLLNFLSSVLREEGGFSFKKAIVDAMVELMNKIPDCKMAALSHLCEFIEDCEFTQLSAEVLHLLGEEGPKTREPAKYIRFIFNRVILESEVVRAAAVNSLAKFGTRCPQLCEPVGVLLRRCLDDDDNEVRDRATLMLKLLADCSAESDAAEAGTKVAEVGVPLPLRASLLAGLPIPVNSLRRSLEAYKLRPADGALTLASLPVVADKVAEAKEVEDAEASARAGGSDAGDTSGPGAAALLYKVPEFAALGPVFRSCRPLELSESETEYVVTCVKHVFQKHLVLQFNVTNTLSDQFLVDISVELEMDDTDMWEIDTLVPCAELPYNLPGVTYVCLKTLHDGDGPLPVADFAMDAQLTFFVKEVDSNGVPDMDDPGYEDQYPLEAIDVSASDFIAAVALPSFRATWESTGNENEVTDRFQLPFDRVDAAVHAVIDCLCMQPCDGTASVPPKAQKHMILLSGVFVGGSRVLVRAAFKLASEGGCLLQLYVRADDSSIGALVVDCIR